MGAVPDVAARQISPARALFEVEGYFVCNDTVLWRRAYAAAAVTRIQAGAETCIFTASQDCP